MHTRKGSVGTDSEKRQSNYEAFYSQDGILRIWESYSLTAPPPLYGRCVAEIRRAFNTQSGQVTLALVLHYFDDDDYEHVGYLDEDEIYSLHKAAEYVGERFDTVRKTATTYTQIDYLSRGGVRFSAYVSEDKATGVCISLGSDSVFFRSVGQVVSILEQAILKIEVLRGQQPLLASDSQMRQ